MEGCPRPTVTAMMLPRRRVLVFAIGAAILGLTCGLLYPVVVVVRDGEAYAESAYNLRQIGLALLNYHQAHRGRLPPAAVRDKDDRPLLSWRVLLLPYLEHDDLYAQFKLDEPWDGPHNKALLEKMPRT